MPNQHRVLYRVRDKAGLRQALRDAGVETFAELERRLTALYGTDKAPTRQYLSRVFQPNGDATTSPETSWGIAYVARVDREQFFDKVDLDAPAETVTATG